MRKFWLLIFIISAPLSAFDFLNFSDQPDRTSGCFEEFGYCPVSCLPNRSFFWSRPVYRNLGAQKPLWQEFVFSKRQSLGLQVVPIFQQSFGTHNIARYFLFDDQLHLLVKGDDMVFNNRFSRDVRAEWIGLPSNFAGTFSIHPKQKQFGIWIEAMIPFSSLCDYELFDYLWFGIAAPYQTIENNIHPSETPSINPSPTFPRNILEALSNPEYLFAKFDGKQKRKAFAEIDLKLGSNLLNRDNFQIGLYSMFVIPLHGAARQEFVFNPYIGNNGHFGYGTGVTFKLPLLCDDVCQLFSFFAYLENIYFFRSRQKRTLDLINKPWSRYILLNSREGAFNVPAVNILTRHVRARPYNMLDLYTGFDWEISNFQVEIGYGLWARGREKLVLDDCFPANFGLAGVGTLSPTDAVPATASSSDISQQGPNDVEFGTNKQIFIPITVQDLDFDSGAARGALAHRGHLSVGYIYSDECLEILFGIGGFIEISQYITAISNWGAWAKVGLSF